MLCCGDGIATVAYPYLGVPFLDEGLRDDGEWIGFEKINHHATDGVAIGECFLHDVEGPIGSASCVALRQARAPS